MFGFFSVAGLEFNQTAIAVILTGIGYSINDKVVNYDRIDENVKKRMLDLCEIEKKRASENERYLHNCQMRVRELEQTIIELSTELGRAKCFIREHN